MTLSVPPKVSCAMATARSAELPDGLISNSLMPLRIRSPSMVSVPMLFPGAKVPPARTDRSPVVPVPPMAAPDPTVVSMLVEMFPLMTSLPPVTLV